jgi:hypothetical protein
LTAGCVFFVVFVLLAQAPTASDAATAGTSNHRDFIEPSPEIEVTWMARHKRA